MPSDSMDLQPIDPKLLPKLDKQYVAFHNKYLLHAPYIQDRVWSPSIRNEPAVPGGAGLCVAALPVSKTRDIDLGDFSIRAFYPLHTHPRSKHEKLPVFIWYHGGGMVLGSINAENPFCTRVCNAARCVVIAVDYRLAPEHKFPIGSEDAWTVLPSAFDWVYKQGEKELDVDTSRLGIGGSSSGGNLAAFVAQRAGSQGMKIDFVVLSNPVCDNTANKNTTRSWDVNRNCPGLPQPKMSWYREQYLPNPEDRLNPIASPLFAPKSAFDTFPPRTFIASGALDLLASEGEAFTEKLKGSAKDVTLKSYPGCPHLFQAMDGVLDVSRGLVRDLCQEVAVNFGLHPEDVNMMDLYPQGMEVEVPQIKGGGAWLRLDRPMVLGEAPLYRESDRTLHYVDCLHDPAELHVLQLDEKGEAASQPKIIELDESVTVACFRQHKPGYICAYFAGVAFMDEETGKLEILKEIIPQEERGIRRFNDGMVDCMGRFWLAEIDRKGLTYPAMKLPKDHGEPIGRLWRYDPDGSVHLMEKGLVCGNGLAWSPDNKTMYLNDSRACVVYAYDFDIPTGNISNKRLFIDRRVLGGEPDGMVVDVTGDLWIAMWGSYRVMQFSSTGKHLSDIIFTAKRMACTAWGGPDNDTLYVASARNDESTRRDDDEGGHLFKWKVGVKGLPKYAFAG